MSKKNNAPKVQNSAKPIWSEIHPNVRQAMIEAKVSAVHGFVSNCSKERVEVSFSHDNNADVCKVSFWFDFSQVEIFPAF